MSYTLPTQPCTTTQVFKESGRLYKKLFKPLSPLNILSLPLFLSLLWFSASISTPYIPMPIRPFSTMASASWMIEVLKTIHWLPIIATFIVGSIHLFLFSFMLLVGQKLISEQKLEYKEASLLALRRFPFYMTTKILVYIATYIGLILLIVPGAVIYVLGAFTIPNILFDEGNIFSSLRHSIKMTWDWDRGWQSFIVLLSNVVPIVLITLCIYRFFGAYLLLQPHTLQDWIINIIVRAIQYGSIFLLIPWTVSSLLVQYANLKNSLRLEKMRADFFKGNKETEISTTA